MRTKTLGLIAAILLGTSGTAFSANRTYYLDLPVTQIDTTSYWAFGSITTNGASAPTASDIVDYKITVYYLGPPSASYTLTPANSTTSSFTGVTETLAALTLNPDGNSFSLVSFNSTQMCPTSAGGAS